MSGRLSICVPTFNRADKLRKLLACLDREIAGAGEEVAVLISDNASEDDTPAVLAEAAGRFPWLRWHRQDSNVGPLRNIGWVIENAPDTEYVWLFGDDDAIVGGGVAQVIELLEAERPAWLHLPHAWVDPLGRVLGSSPLPRAVERYSTAGDMYRAHHHWLTFMSASVALADPLRVVVQESDTRNAYHQLLWWFRSALESPCVVAGERIVHGSPEICWEDRKVKIQTLDFTSLYDDGLHLGLSAAEFGATLDGLYDNGFAFELWQQLPIEELARVVSRFPQSRSLRKYLWQIARAQARRDVVSVLDDAARAMGDDAEAEELVRAGEEAFAAGDCTGAAEHFIRAVDRMPTSVQAWNDLGVVAHHLRQPNARELLDNALFVDPSDGDALGNLAALSR
jgi:glycosyltransferase involved in cell wall biosynthesis